MSTRKFVLAVPAALAVMFLCGGTASAAVAAGGVEDAPGPPCTETQSFFYYPGAPCTLPKIKCPPDEMQATNTRCMSTDSD